MQKDEQTLLVEKFCADDCAGSSKDCGSDEHRGIEAKVSARVCWVRAAKGVGPTDFRPKKHELSTSAGFQVEVGCYMLRVIWYWSVTNNISFEVFSHGKSNRGKLVLWRSLGHMTFSSEKLLNSFTQLLPVSCGLLWGCCCSVNRVVAVVTSRADFPVEGLDQWPFGGFGADRAWHLWASSKEPGQETHGATVRKTFQMKIPNFNKNVII